jgi:pimeloyl-ACP methyl ester carboxylesterase/AraC-like DNA-binding protein
VVIDAETSGDFCLLSRFTDEDCERFQVPSENLIAYHYVRAGRLYASVDGEPPLAARAGDIILLPRNDAHLLCSRPGLPPIDSHDLITQQAPGAPAKIVIDHGGEEAGLYCGFLGVSAEHHPLLDSLPPILKLDGRDDVHAEWIETSMRLLNEAGNSPELVARLAELFFAEAIRRYMEHLRPGEGGWLAGLKDPAVAKALAVIHSRYAEELDVETLAREAGVSRTVLGEKFAELIGEPPMRYCARWRMRIAANMLRDGKQNASNVAYAVGFNSEAAFTRAFKREYGEPPATWRRKAEEQSKARTERSTALPEQLVRYCTAKDGTRLAFSVVGQGPPLVKAANWLNHLEHDWKSPVWRHWLHEFTRGHTLIRYDERANGLSDWDTPEISFEAFVDDLECVVDCAGLDRFDLLGISQGASVAIAYAVRHPERVRKLVILGGYAVGWARRNDPDEIAKREAMIALTEVGWGADHPAYRQLFTNLYIPGGTAEQIDWFNEVQRVSASPENAVKLQRALSQIDVHTLLPRVTTPTIIFHSKDDQVVPFAAGEYLARGIRGSIFVPLEGDNHILLEKEPAWHEFVRLSREFLGNEGSSGPTLAARARKEEVVRCSSSDGTTLTYASLGEGEPLAMPAVWFHHIEKDLTAPAWAHWMAEASRGHRLIRSDMRGVGLSDHDPPRWTFDALLEDFEAVVEDSGLEQFDLLGMSHGVLVAIAFAARHPERVRKMLLFGGYAAGFGVRGDPEEIQRRETLLALGRGYAPSDRLAFARMLGALYWPSAGGEMIDWFGERLGTISLLSESLQNVFRDIDLRADLTKIRAPTLVMHSRGDRIIPAACSEELATGIDGAKLVLLKSENHMPLADEPAWSIARASLRSFLRS